MAVGAISVVDQPPTCVHAMGTVPKDDGAVRVIIDCSAPGEIHPVNAYTDQVCIPFSYNSVDDVTDLLTGSEHLATVDISDAYRSISTDVESSSRQGLSWEVNGITTYYRDNRLSMGLSSSPYIFSKVSDFIVRSANRRGCGTIINYLDDFCVIGKTKNECGESQQVLLATLRAVGFSISFKKLTPPATTTRFLGILIDSIKMNLSLPQDKMEKLTQSVDEVLQLRKVKKKQLEQVAGYLAHASKVVRGGRVFSRRIYNTLSALKKRHHKVRVGGELKKDLLWWKEFAAQFNGAVKILGPTTPVISTYSDSSNWGFGGAPWGGLGGEPVGQGG